MLQHALEYWDKGMSIFPLKPNQKTPLTEALPLFDGRPSWIPFQSERATREKVVEWWTEYPNANIAGVMGKISGKICADQDVLKDKNGMPVFDEFGHPVERGDISGFPPTLSATTWSGGKHMIYPYVNGVPTKQGFRKLVDIKSDGSYIVLSPSTFNGKSYEWDVDWKEMWDVLTPFPVEVLQKVENVTEQRLDVRQLISVEHGSRNDKMHKLACSLYAKGHTDEDVVLIASEINRTYKPPIGEQRGDKPDELVIILNSAKKFITSANQGKNKDSVRSFDLLLWKEFDAIEFPENPWRIKKLMPEYGITLLAAPSRSGKSWVAMEMIRSIALGVPFLGTFETKQGNVLYVEQETPQVEIQRRGRQLCLNNLENVWMVSSKDEPLNLNNPDVVKQLIDHVKAKNICTVFIDTFRSVAGGIKEQNADEIRTFFNRFRPIVENGVAVVVLDHTRKPNQFEKRTKPMLEQIFSSQDKVAVVVNVLMIGPSEEKNSLALHQMKLKCGKENNPFNIIMRDEDEGSPEQKTFLEYGGEFNEEQFKVEHAKDAIVEYLKAQGSEKSANDIREALSNEVGKSNIDKALKHMREHKGIGSRREGKAYLYRVLKADEFDEMPEQDTLDISS